MIIFNANLFTAFDLTADTLEDKVKAGSVSQLKVLELNLAFIWPRVTWFTVVQLPWRLPRK
jgi:hypothetical protein